MNILIKFLGGYTKAEVGSARAVRTQTLIEAATEAAGVRDVEWSAKMAKQEKEVSRRLVGVFTEIQERNSKHKPLKDHMQSLINAETSKLLDAKGSKQHAAACRAYESRLGGVSPSVIAPPKSVPPSLC